MRAGRLDDHGDEEATQPEQVVRKLTTADRLLAEGKDGAAVCRELGVSEQMYHRWRNTRVSPTSRGTTADME
jgi:putative transposase